VPVPRERPFLKVLHYADENRLSWAIPWAQIIGSLGSRGIKNVVVCRPGGTLSEILSSAGIDHFEYRPHVSAVPAFCKGFEKLLELIKPDIIHTRLSSAANIAGFWAKRTGIPLASTVDKFPKARYYKNADCLVAVSNSVLAHCSSWGLKGIPIKVIPNSLDVCQYRPSGFDRNSFRSQHSLDPCDRVILGAGRLVSWKGFDLIMRSLPTIANKWKAELWIAGSGPEETKLRNLTNDLSIKVKFWGFVSDIRPLMWASDLFVLPSVEPEPFGLVLLEAMAAGVPVIASKAGGAMDLVEREDFLFRPGDASDLEAKIQAILEGNSFKELADYSRTRASLFDNLAVLDSFLEVYRSLVSRNGAVI
jgi:glycosyltransferase involved in cell wall biosynthesis